MILRVVSRDEESFVEFPEERRAHFPPHLSSREFWMRSDVVLTRSAPGLFRIAKNRFGSFGETEIAREWAEHLTAMVVNDDAVTISATDHAKLILLYETVTP